MPPATPRAAATALAAALGLATTAAAQPKIGASEILNHALTALKAMPAGRTHWQFLAARGLTVSIGRDAQDPPGFHSRLRPGEQVIAFGADFLDGVFTEVEAHGVTEPREVARHLGVKLAPSLAHEACHAEVAAVLKSAAGVAAPAFLEEEALCLYEELLVWRDLTVQRPWLVFRARTDLDRLRDALEAMLRGGPDSLAGRAALHYPGLPSVRADRLKNLSKVYPSPVGDAPSPAAVRAVVAERTVDRLEELIDLGGAALQARQEALSRAEKAVSDWRDLSMVHLPRAGGEAAFLLNARAYEAARKFFDEKMRFVAERLETPSWRDWRRDQYPGFHVEAAGDDEERLRLLLEAARRSAKEAPDLKRRGNPLYLRKARKLARALGKDIRAADREVTLLQEAKIQRLLANAERLAPSSDQGQRRWAYLALLRAEMEAREVWDMTPHWIVGRERNIIDAIKRAAAQESGPSK